MRLSTLCSALVNLAVVTTSWAQVTPAVPPTFKSLFVGTFNRGEAGTVNGPYGTRVLGPITGGNLSDTSGNLVATILASVSETGIIGNNGAFYSQLILSLRWEVDQKYAYLNAVGVGNASTGDLNYLHLETDSETYSDLNGQFLLAQVDFPSSGSSAALTIFGTQ